MTDEKYLQAAMLFLKNTVVNILSGNPNYDAFASSYTHAYNLVLYNHGMELYNELHDMIVNHLKDKVCSELILHTNSSFLEELDSFWCRHQQAMEMIQQVFLYMNNRLFPRQHLEALHTFGSITFRDIVVTNPSITNMQQNYLSAMIAQERGGISINRETVRNICSMLMTVGSGLRNVYEDVFERHFLQQTASFYSVKSSMVLEKNRVTAYIDTAEAIIQEEVDRVRHCLDPSTEPHIVKVLEEVLIERHMHTIIEEVGGMQDLLVNGDLAALKQMFQLLRRVPEGISVISKCFSEHLRERGCMIMAKEDSSWHSEAASSTPHSFGYKAIALVKKLLVLLDTTKQMLNISFNNDPNIRHSITHEFEHFINSNPQIPEYVSLYLHDKLKKRTHKVSKGELEHIINLVILLVRFMYDKDLFVRYYRQHLARRLLLDQSTSKEYENFIISRLRDECGYLKISNLEGMFNDIDLSVRLQQDFQQQKENIILENSDDGVDVNIQVLSPGYWPLDHRPPKCNIPLEITSAFEHFQLFYLSQYKYRQLVIHPLLGTAEVAANFYGTETLQPRRHLLHVSTFMMCVLMLFNDSKILSYEEIATATQIPERELVRTLQSMSVGKKCQHVLVKQPNTKDIGPQDSFAINDNFYSENLHVNIQMRASRRVESETEHCEQRSEAQDDRRYDIEAAIVRVMKNKEKLQHQMLVNHVTEQLEARFVPSVIEIKQRIEALIERAYLKISEKNSMTYEYIP